MIDTLFSKNVLTLTALAGKILNKTRFGINENGQLGQRCPRRKFCGAFSFFEGA